MSSFSSSRQNWGPAGGHWSHGWPVLPLYTLSPLSFTCNILKCDLWFKRSPWKLLCRELSLAGQREARDHWETETVILSEGDGGKSLRWLVVEVMRGSWILKFESSGNAGVYSKKREQEWCINGLDDVVWPPGKFKFIHVKFKEMPIRVQGVVKYMFLGQKKKNLIVKVTKEMYCNMICGLRDLASVLGWIYLLASHVPYPSSPSVTGRLQWLVSEMAGNQCFR